MGSQAKSEKLDYDLQIKQNSLGLILHGRNLIPSTDNGYRYQHVKLKPRIYFSLDSSLKKKL